MGLGQLHEICFMIVMKISNKTCVQKFHVTKLWLILCQKPHLPNTSLSGSQLISCTLLWQGYYFLLKNILAFKQTETQNANKGPVIIYRCRGGGGGELRIFVATTEHLGTSHNLSWRGAGRRNWGAFSFLGWKMGGLKMLKDDLGGGLQVSFKQHPY